MNRRSFLATAAAAGVAGTAGCGALRGTESLADPTVLSPAPQRGSLSFTQGGSELANFGADGTLVDDSVVRLGTELSHREGTSVTRIRLRVWMPDRETNTPADVAVISPVEGDSSPPPSLTLFTPERAPGTAIAVRDLDDLADETISTLDLLVRPRGGGARTVAIDVSVALSEGGALGTDYDLEGRFDLEFPDLVT